MDKYDKKFPVIESQQQADSEDELVVSTGEVPQNQRFKFWQSFIKDLLGSCEFYDLEDVVFGAEFSLSSIGNLKLCRFSGTPQGMDRQSSRLNSSGNGDIYVVMESSFKTFNLDHGGHQRSGRGGITLVDSTQSYRVDHPEGVDIVDFFIPRAEWERALGPARLAAGLTIDADQASFPLISTYLRSLAEHGPSLDETRAARLTTVAVELLAAGFAEKMELSPTRSLSGAATLTRAQAYIANNISKAGLSMLEVAAALQVSLRHLHKICAQEDISLMDWMWERRLLSAREKLAHAAYRAVPVSMVAYQCGFADQAHFSRRFKERFGLPPTEWKVCSIAGR